VWLNGIGEIAECGSRGPIVVSSFDDYGEGSPQDIESVWWNKVYPDNRVPPPQGFFSFLIGDFVLAPPWIDWVES